MALGFYQPKEDKKDNRSFISKASDALFGNTKKFVGTAKAGAGGVYGLGKIAASSVFGDDDDYKKTVKGVDETLTKDLEGGKSFFANREEAQDASATDLVRKTVSKGVGTATEIVPFFRGAQVASNVGKTGVNLAKAAAEGVGYGAANSAAEQIDDGEDGIDLGSALKDTLIGAASGGVGFGIGKGVSKGIDNLKPVHAYNGGENATGFAEAEAKGATFKGKDGKTRFEQDDSQARVRRLKEGFNDDLSNVLVHPTLYNDYPDLASLKVSVQKLKPGEKAVYSPNKDMIAVSPETASSAEKFKSALLHETQHAIQKREGFDMGTNLKQTGGDMEAYRSNPGEQEARTVQARMNMTPAQRAAAPSLVDVDTAKTSAAHAQSVIASTSMDIKPVDRAKRALTGQQPVTDVATPVGEGAKSIAAKLDEQLTSLGGDFAAPEEVIKALAKGDAVKRQARKHDWLDRYEDTLSVLGRHFGKVGTDLGYKLAEGAKRVSDIQEVVRPSIDTTKKLLDGMSKSKAGRAEIQERVYSALEDRANASQYLRNPKEMELYEEAVKVFDFFKQQRIAAGKSVIENDYSPRAAVSNALDAPERLLQDARSAFSPEVKSRFSKERSKKIEDAEINRNIIDLLPMYASSQSKEFGYEGAMKFAVEKLKEVNPAYITDQKARRQGEEYLRDLLSQVLDPPTTSKSVQRQNKLIGQTYKANLKWSPRYALQNMTQRFATKSVVSKQAEKLAKDMDKTDVDMIRKGLFAGDSTITDEINNTAESLGNAPKKKGIGQYEWGSVAERGNVHGAFDRGVAQQLVESEPYKAAIKQGFSRKEAAKMALQDETVRDLAIRRGNMVMNDTQFGANFVTKPEFFREAKTFFGLSDKWYKQYQRFPQGMIQNMSIILRANDARALDILKRGDPTQTPLVDFKYSAEALHNGVDDLIKGIKNGEISDVSLEVAEGYQKTLAKAIKQIDTSMKDASQVRGGKTAKSVVKMWAAASAIQWLFDGGFAMTEAEDQQKAVQRAAMFGSPVSIPTKDQNPLAGAAIPASPFRPELQPRRLLNFVPGVGMVVNRGREVNRFVNALTGDDE